MQGASALLPLLRSPFQGEMLALLYLNPDREFSAIDLAKRFGVSHATASREADRLGRAGLIRQRRVGATRLLRAATDTRLARPLTDLLAVTYGPIAVLGELIAGIPGVRSAYIYGSWAARYQGEPGPIPDDVDVLVIGDASGGLDPDALYDVERAAERRLHRPVSIRPLIIAPLVWRRRRRVRTDCAIQASCSHRHW